MGFCISLIAALMNGMGALFAFCFALAAHSRGDDHLCLMAVLACAFCAVSLAGVLCAWEE